MKLSHRIKRIFEYMFRPVHLNSQNALYDTPAQISPDTKIYGMYHIYCANSWKELFQDQINSLEESSLLEKTSKLFISVIINNDEDVTYIKSFDKHGKFQIINVAKDASKFEFPALEYIKTLSTQEEFFVYYFHTKGVSINSQSYKNYTKYHTKLPQLVKNSNYWRKMMEYWNFNKYNLAINTLKSGYDTYGVYIRNYTKYAYYGGNFWWAKSSFIAGHTHTLTEEEKKSRFAAETWLLSQANKPYCAFYCITGLYSCPMYESIYESENHLFNKECMIFIFHYYRFCLSKILEKMLVFYN